METNQSLELQPANPQPQALARIEENPLAAVAGMLQGVVDKGITAENVAAAEKLIGLLERLQDKKGQQEFNKAFAAMQMEMPKVEASQPVPNRDGTVRYKFAPFEGIMATVQPFLTKHGFSVSFKSAYDGPRIIKTCILRHTGGHSSEHSFAVRIGGGPPGSTESQADGAAGTYAKRFALCDALNIVIEKDSDGRNIGEPIGPEAGRALRNRLIAVKGNEDAFLGLAGIPPLADNATDADALAAFAAIPSTALANLEELLSRKERKK